jgi:hypothetical protein
MVAVVNETRGLGGLRAGTVRVDRLGDPATKHVVRILGGVEDCSSGIAPFDPGQTTAVVVRELGNLA